LGHGHRLEGVRGRQNDAEQAKVKVRKQQPSSPPDHAVLALQREAGNAAVTRLLQRDDAPGFSPVRPGSQLGMRPTPTSVLDYAPAAAPEHGAAVEAVVAWFRAAAAEITSGRSAGFFQSVPELVKAARELPWRVDGKSGKVGDQMSAGAVETLLRDEAKSRGVRLLEHRSLTDKAGARSEVAAILENLGRIPTEIEFGGAGAKLVVSIAGKVTGEVGGGKGGAKLKVGGSSEGGEATYTPPGGGPKVGVKGGPEGAGASIMYGGNKVSIEVADKQVKAEVKAGDLLTVKGSAGTDKDGVFAWRADIQIGTLGKVATVEDIAKLMIGAQDTFGKAAGDLSKGLSLDKAKEHGGAVKDAVTKVVDAAEKSAKQGKKGGWGVGLSAKGDDRGGWSAGVTFTWSW
jgi:hypothetical protein